VETNKYLHYILNYKVIKFWMTTHDLDICCFLHLISFTENRREGSENQIILQR
jgi:hypothetical protein